MAALSRTSAILKRLHNGLAQRLGRRKRAGFDRHFLEDAICFQGAGIGVRGPADSVLVGHQLGDTVIAQLALDPVDQLAARHLVEFDTAILPGPTGSTGAEEAVVTTNFSLFREKEIKLGDRSFEVIAGHHFNKGTDTQFENAWCCISEFADGMTLKISLGHKLPSASPQIDLPNAGELAKVGISRADHLSLFNACPWLDGNPDLSEVTPDPVGAAYVFAGEVTAQSVDRLIEAVKNGASRVLFNSPGGSLENAMRGFSVLKGKDIEAVVTGECSSACTLLFLAGQSRSITQEGSVGVHQWRTVGSETNESEAQLLSGTLVALMREAGVSEDFFIAGSFVPPDEILWLSHDQLRDWGVLTS